MISILMPFYNGREFLIESISSIVNQSYKDWELIIGINGIVKPHHDSIINIINSFNDKRIKFIVSDKRGKIKTLNKLIYFTKYSKIAFIDVDDLWMPTKLEDQLPFINKYDVVGSDAEYFGEKDGYPGLFLGELSPDMFSWHNPIINSSVIMNKSDIYWNEKWEGLDDYNLWVHLLKKNKTFYNVPKVLIKHRIHKKSFFNNKNHDKYLIFKNKKIKKLNEDEILHLSDIFNNNKWKL